MKTSGYFILLALCMVNFAYAQQEKPNILWITIEDTSPQFIGAYGNQNAETLHRLLILSNLCTI